jgi:predicted ATPase
LFVEELTKNVLESGLLTEEGGGYRLEGPLPPLAIPSTLQDSLMARLDRLAAVKEIAQIGAAIGREFSYSLLHAVIGRDEPTLKTALAQLEESELVFRSGDPPAARYAFKHALVQDTAYGSLLRSRRQILHQRIAEILREKFADVVEAEPELLAHHFTEAGLTAPAIEYWGKAGDLALRRSAFKEAIAHLGKAIEMTEASAGDAATEQPGGKLKLQVLYGNALISARGYGAPETTAAFVRAQESASTDREAPERFSVIYGVWVGSYLRGELADMRAHAATFLRDVEGDRGQPEACVAGRVAGLTNFSAGEYAEARIHLERALTLFDPERDGDQAFRFGHDSGLGAMVYLALTLWPLGDIERALQLIQAAKGRMAGLTHIGSVTYGHLHAALFGLMRGDFARATRHGAAVADLANEHDLRLWHAFGVFFKGWAAWREGDKDRGRAEMRRGVALLQEQNAVIFDGLIKMTLAEAEAQDGDFALALATVDSAVALSERTGQRNFDAEVFRTRGEILRKQSSTDPGPAEKAFLAAIAIAHHQKARSFELRAALSLAKLYRATGRDADAHAVLRPALEGFAPTLEFPEIGAALELMAAIEPRAHF